MTARHHRHWFTSLWSHFGEYGPRDVHVHNCIEGEPGDCWRVVIGQGVNCSGKDTPHERMTLTEDGPKPVAALKRLREAQP